MTGTAAWNYYAITQYILGIRPDYYGLIVDPVIPKSWKGFKVKRKFRGSIYDIEVENPYHISSGIKEISIIGKKVDELLIPAFNDGKTHKIKIVLGN